MTDADDAGGRAGPWRRSVVAGVVANLAAGTLFGWSLVARPASDAVGMRAGGAAAVFASAIVVFAAVLLALGPVQRWAGPRRLLFAAAGLGGGGLLLAATAAHPAVLWIGVALLFGTANGLAYGVAVGLATRVPPRRRGTATGLVVSAYAAGPVVLGMVAPTVLDAAGWRPALAGLAVIVAGLLAGAGPHRTVVLLWVVFAGGTAPGLLLFAHAVAVAGDRELSLRLAGLAVSALAAGNLAGRLAAGAWSDRIGRPAALTAALVAGAGSIGLLAFPGPSAAVFAGFLGTGLAYGAVSALVPAATADHVDAAVFPAAYGLAFTGWGCAGLLAPVAGGPLVRLAGEEPGWLALAATPFVAAAAAVFLLGAGHRRPG